MVLIPAGRGRVGCGPAVPGVRPPKRILE